MAHDVDSIGQASCERSFQGGEDERVAFCSSGLKTKGDGKVCGRVRAKNDVHLAQKRANKPSPSLSSWALTWRA